MATQGNDTPARGPGVAPERLEPDLTPAPGTPRSEAAASDQEVLGFDPESPDVADPQVDPTHPAKPPAGPTGHVDKRAKGDSYPPYDGPKG